MATVAVLNNDAALTGKTLALNEGAGTVTALWTFDRDPSAPFAVSASSAVVSNLDADKLDGVEAAAMGQLAVAAAWTADQTFNDNVNLTFGTGGDVDLDYDGTDLVLNLTVVGTGDFVINGGSVELDDSESLTLGTGKDATLLYNGTDLVISPAAVGSGDIIVTGSSIELDDNESLTLGGGKDATLLYDGTNLVVEPRAVGSGHFIINDACMILINDTANANMTTGLTIAQAGADNQILCLKSSDIASAVTTATVAQDVETDDYFTISKRNATLGGTVFQSIGESGVSVGHWHDTYAGAPDTTDTTGSNAAMAFYVGEHDGANGLNDMAANSNALVIGEITSASARLVRFLLKADDGELHLGNTTLVALDDEDDVGLVRAMQWETSQGEGMQPTPWNTADYGVPAFSYERLKAVGVLGEKDAEGNCLMRVQPRFAMNEGAIWQLHVQLREAAARIATLEQKLLEA